MRYLEAEDVKIGTFTNLMKIGNMRTIFCNSTFQLLHFVNNLGALGVEVGVRGGGGGGGGGG